MDARTGLFGWGLLLTAAGLFSCKSTRDETPPQSVEGTALFAKHCASCHGESGYGDGVAAIALDVAPRSFREEPFRYVSTMNGVPTRDDLVRTIREGRRFGEMPRHRHLADKDVALLADYVLDFHRLGWIARLEADATEGEELEREEILEIAREKITPAERVTVGSPPAGFKPDTEKGRTLYIANCAACHGTEGRGDGLEIAKDSSLQTLVSETVLAAVPKDERGRPIKVRDLTSGQFLGGASPHELFKRIRCGVPGTPMASQALLTDEEVWELVYYSLHLGGR